MICLHCNKEYTRSKDFRTKYRTYSNFCSQKCYDKHRQPKIKIKLKDFKDTIGLSETCIRSTIIKLQLIDLLGGKCTKCGYDKNLSALDFHHINSSIKEFELTSGNILRKSDEELLNEVLKCDLLCANCHREVHSPNKNIADIRKITSGFKFKRKGKRKVN